ncbi:MAG: hypothetical protein NTW19_05805 [Planctomycetota bacterium]|nr:hypothetical protein [Planctomycetota bacterium]
MPSIEELYAELKPDMEAVAAPLFEFSETCIDNQGDFLPHGAGIDEEGEVRLIAAAPEDGADLTTAEAVLPVLHQGLRKAAKADGLLAVGVAESVTIEPNGAKRTRAMKVLFEHKRGLTLALYLPFTIGPKGKMKLGEMLIMPADPEVNAWGGKPRG